MEKRIISILLIFFLFTSNILASELNLDSKKYILYNMNDNRVLVSKNENSKSQIASLTKIMTTIVAIENIEDFDKKITITDEMFKDVAWDVSVAGFKVGDSVTYNDLLYGALLPSGADAVNALAYSVTDSYDDFIKLMNKKVEDLNLKNTHFTNVIGLYDKDNYSTAYDVSKILIYSLKNKKFKSVFETRNYTSTNGIKMESTIESYNKHANNENINFITGSKTGYISKSGYCLATTATIDNVDYLLVTLNAYSENSPHIKDAVDTYNYYSKNYSYQSIVDKDTIITTLKTKNSKEKNIDIISGVSREYYLINDYDKADIKYEYDGLNVISYFTKKGTKLGIVKIKYKDEVIDKFDLIYTQSLTFSLLSFLWCHKILTVFIIIFLLLLFRAIQVKIRRLKRKKRRAKMMK